MGEDAKEAVQAEPVEDFLTKVDKGLISADAMIKNLTPMAGEVTTSFKPQQIGLGLPPKETAFSMTKASYQDYAPRLIDGWQLKQGTPTLKIYNKGNDMVVSARGTRPSDPNDLKADALIPVSQLGLSERMKGDIDTLKKFQIRFPPTKYSYSGVGHSLGGAVIDEFIKQGLVKDGRTYNPAVTTMDWGRAIPNHRVYMDADPLYQMMGSHTKNPEVRHYEPKQPTSFFGRVASMFPVAKSALQLADAHNLDNFTGGATKSLLKDAGLTPQTYLAKVKQNAKGKGIDTSKLFLANDGVHKLMYKDDNRTSKFGRTGYGDFIIYSELERLKKVPAGHSLQKRNTFHSSHEKIKGDWRSDPLSPNNLALKVLW